jgi:hypothetical protein
MTGMNVTRAEEAQHLIELYGGDAPNIMGRIEGQLAILASRAQTLLSLAGITITVTGFSGASIAKSGTAAAVLLVTGLVLVLVAAAHTMWEILRVRWSTTLRPCALAEAVDYALAMRDRKTLAYSRALVLLILGLTLYVSSVGMLLLASLAGTGAGSGSV